MAGNIKGITIQFNGDTTKLDKALRQIRNSTKDIDKELKDVDKALKFNPKSVELWRQKQDLLRQKIAQTKDNLAQLKNAQAQLDAKGVDKNSEEYRALQREIITTESKLKNFKKQLNEVGNANLKALSAQLKEIGDKMTSVGRTMTQNVTAPIVAGYTLAAKSASDYEENLNKIEVAFGSSSDAVKEWANTARTQFGLSKVQATDAASAFGALGKGIGLSEQDAAEMSMTLAGLSADLGSYFNVGVDESAKALEGIFTGESEALKKFGVVMTDTNLKQFAEDQGLVWNEMDQSQKTMLRYQYVLAQTKDAQGDFSRTSDGLANSTKIFHAAIQDLGTAIGTNLLPIISPVIQKITEWINKFNELDPQTQKIITIIGLVVAAIGPLFLIVGKFATALSSIIAIAPMVGTAVTTMLGPVGLIIAAIAAVIAAGVYLYKHWDEVKAKAAELWGKVTEVFEGIKAKIVGVWDNIKTTTATIWKAIKTAVMTPINAVKNAVSKVWDFIKTNTLNRFNAIKTAVTTVWNGIKKAITKPIETAKNTIKTAIDKIKSIINGAKLQLPKFKLPHFKIHGGKLPWGIGGKGEKPTIDVKWYAKGGIFNSPNLIGVGEAGPEAVVPLDKFWDKLDKLQGETNIVINVYGDNADPKQIANEVRRMLIKETNQRRLAWQ